MSTEREGRGVIALAAVGVAVCCGLPALLGAGAAVTVLGLGLASWALVLAGTAVVALGLFEARRRRALRRQADARTTRGA
jgi:uncharacterized membrane protein